MTDPKRTTVAELAERVQQIGLCVEYKHCLFAWAHTAQELGDGDN